MRHLWLVFSLVLLGPGCSGCGGPEERLGYQVDVRLEGSVTAFAGRSITVGGKAVPSPSAVGADIQRAEVSLCTASRDRFLGQETLEVVVRSADGGVTTTQVPRYACRLSEQPGTIELLNLRLEENGRARDSVPGDPRVYSTCASGWTPLCPTDEF